MKRLVIFWVVSLVFAGMAAYSFAQNRSRQPQMVSGDDIGFRVEGTDVAGKPTGTFMVRINGNWVELGAAGSVRPATQ